MNCISRLLLHVIFTLVPISTIAQPSFQAVFVSRAPIIDGHLNDEAWTSAAKIDQLVQREPNPGQPVSEKTIFYICYDASFLYVGIKCFDDPKKITAKEMARDISLGNDDRIQVILDTYLDHRNGYWFQIGPRGSIGDATISENGAVFNKEWNGLWDGRARIVADGWEAEMAIPFKTMGFDKYNPSWGIKFIRHIKRKLEMSYWPFANVNSYKFQVSDAGLINGLNHITQGIGLDILPYIVGGINTKRDANNKYVLKGGLDFFYQITPGLKASLSVNTDFAETEVDDRQINLTRFDLLFPEKRDFFLDGSSLFSFGIQGDDANSYGKNIIPFFSRRMGLDSNGLPLQINYAAKVTGMIKKWNIGAMQVNDDHFSGNSNFSVARISRSIGSESSVGVIGTYGNAVSATENYVGGIDMKLATSKFHGNKNLSMIMFGLKSGTSGLTGKDLSWGGTLSYPNDFLSFSLGHYEIGKNFVAGMGFVPRTDIKDSYGNIQIGPRPKIKGILQLLTGIGFNHIVNFNDVLETRQVSYSPLKIRFKSGEEFAYSIVGNYEYLEKNFNIFSKYIIPVGQYYFYRHTLSLLTAGSRNLSGDCSFAWGDFYNGSRRDLNLGINYKVAVPLFVGAKYKQNDVSLPNGNFTARIYSVNANILFSPTVTFNNYLQYDNFSNTIGIQSRFQWILKPGKVIILAWTTKLSQPLERYVMDESALRFKLKYNIRF
ncbi:MAG: carbohydrate binding family 9 domain-containing protein [Prolixibacteraceae bacterium]|nr:carbohydrate binding family 9 domain-containing protein [Prolixibacteraceae bacterium]